MSIVVSSGIHVINVFETSFFLDQRLSEKYGLLKCFLKISEGELSELSECSKYAQFHYPLYPEFFAATPAESACLVSKDILKVLRIDCPSSLGEVKLAEERVKRNCAL